MSKQINANYGIVRSVSADRSRIKIRSPRGGTFECRNEGFEIGQAVCFILDALNKKVVKVLPKEVADVQAMLGLNPELQEALADEPEEETVVINDDPELMEDIDEIIYDVTSEGYIAEEYLDFVSEIPGEEAERWDDADWPGNQE
jgi:hypothetical protein